MCGILGVAGARVSRAEFESALRLIAHRGPDDEGIYQDGTLFLGHRRLSVIDPAGGHQPMSSPDGRFVLSYGGEIYNYRELRHALALDGFRFRTASDTEVLLCWLIRHGIDGLAELNGMFHFGLWDRAERKLLLARDRLGIKPLYYGVHGGWIVFGSEIKALVPFLSKREADREAVFEFLTFQNVLSERTFFKDVRKLQPGHWLVWQPDGWEEGVFWSLDFPEPFEGSYEDAEAAYLETLEASVARHLRSDVEVGAYLSGGFDSSTVAVLAAERMSKTLHTFTGAFTDAPYYDERDGSRAVARSIGAELHEIEITPRDFVENLEDVVYHLDEPTLGTGAFPHYMVSRLVSRSVKVVLTGHGGDEMYAGYQVNKAALIRETLASHPLGLLPALFGVQSDEWSRVLYYLLYPIVYPEVRDGIFVMIPRRGRGGFFTEDFQNENRTFEPLGLIEERFAGRNCSPSQRLFDLYVGTYLPALFIQEDKVSMAHSVEARTPLCDNQMLDLALSLPLSFKLRGNRLKALTKDAMRARLPEALYRMPKRGFPTPFARWYRKEPLRGFMADLLLGERARDRGIMKTSYLRRELEGNDRSSRDTLFDYARANRLYSAAVVELWFRTFIDCNPVAAARGEAAAAGVSR
jgi:asparagine synthase (glutamine-hydrolysing)